MPSCVMRKCFNYSATTNKSLGTTFHLFPRNELLRQKWVDIVRKQRSEYDWIPSKCSQICSQHFNPKDMYITGKGRRWLRKSALPIIEETNTSSKPYSPPKTPESLDEMSVSDTDSTFDAPHRAVLKTRLGQIHTEKQQPVTTNRSVFLKNKHLKKRCESMRKIVGELKNKKYISEDWFTELDAEAEVVDLENRIHVEHKHPSHCKKNSPALRKFALTLNFCSPSAYKYVRRIFGPALPHPQTLGKWYENNRSDPGFTKQALEILNRKFLVSGKRLICTLLVNEIALHQQTIWNGKKTEGVVDYGAGTSVYSAVATQAYVFILVSLDENWQIPVGYFFVNVLPAENRANLISLCLRECHKVGVDVVAITFDGCLSNINAANILGCDLKDANNLKTTFKHPDCDNEVAIIIDPCHMIKLVRNTFEAEGLIFDISDGTITWQLLTNLNQLQTNEGFNFANKITTPYLTFRNEIMKVKLATQLMSLSVANALKLCSELLPSPLFTDTEATVDFLIVFNYLFDILNSRKSNPFGLKYPMCPGNADDVNQFLEKAKEYILSLSIQNKIKRDNREVVTLEVTKKRLVECKSRTGFLGFLICIESLKYLYTNLVEKEKRLSYIETYRFNQDHIEILFDNIRKPGGYNDNPNVIQFKGVYKKLLSCIEFRFFASKCTSLEYFPIINCPSAVSNINQTCSKRFYDNKLIIVSNEHITIESDIIVRGNVEYFSVTLNNELVTDSVKKIVGYISGWVAKCLLKVIKCEFCVNCLLANEKLWFHRLITIKDMGGLCLSSKDLYTVCLKSESIIKNYINEKGLELISACNIEWLKIRILTCFLGTSTFSCLNEHSREQLPTFNHRLHLLRAVIDKYVNVRLHYILKNNSVIHTLSKSQKPNKVYVLE